MTSVKSERYYVKTLFRVLFPYASSFCSSYMELFYAVECDGTGFVQKFDTTETKLILHVLTSLQQQQKQNMKVRRNISCYNFLFDAKGWQCYSLELCFESSCHFTCFVLLGVVWVVTKLGRLIRYHFDFGIIPINI